MTLYYEGRSARITHEVFEALRPCRRTFAVRELAYIHTVRDSIADIAADTTPLRVCTTGMAGLSAALAGADWPIPTTPSVTVIVVGVGVSSFAGVATWSWRRRPWELRAVYRGELVCLFRTADRLVLGQVCRALLRVKERIDEGR